MDGQEHQTRRARVLSLDGGGVRGLVTIQILMELEKKVKAIDPDQDIRSCFDLIGGTSTGGILAMALVATNLSLDKINELYKRLPGEVFDGWMWWKSFKVGFSSLVGGSGCKYSPEALERLIDETFQKGRKLKDLEGQRLKGFVTATKTEKNKPSIYLFRTYRGSTLAEQDVHKLRGTCDETGMDVTIRQALRATSAAPTYFPEIRIPIKRFYSKENKDDTEQGSFVDGGFLCNNPVEVAVAEAFEQWPDRGISTVLSLGTGAAKNEPTGGTRSNIAYAKTALELATDSDRAADRMQAMTQVVRLMGINEVRAGLKQMDDNNDGKVSVEEFHKFLSKLNIHKGKAFRLAQAQSVQDEDFTAESMLGDFENHLDEYYDFPEFFRLNTPFEYGNLGKISLDTTDERELKRMVDETNRWLKTSDVQNQLRMIAERLTHKAPSLELFRQLSRTPKAAPREAEARV